MNEHYLFFSEARKSFNLVHNRHEEKLHTQYTYCRYQVSTIEPGNRNCSARQQALQIILDLAD